MTQNHISYVTNAVATTILVVSLSMGLGLIWKFLSPPRDTSNPYSIPAGDVVLLNSEPKTPWQSEACIGALADGRHVHVWYEIPVQADASALIADGRAVVFRVEVTETCLIRRTSETKSSPSSNSLDSLFQH